MGILPMIATAIMLNSRQVSWARCPCHAQKTSYRNSLRSARLRPIFHHTQDRTQARILVCFLALALWRTLQQWMSSCGPGTAARKLLDEMAEVHSMDVILPTGAGRQLRLRLVNRPEPAWPSSFPQRLGLPLPNRPKPIQNVVTKTAP